MPWDLQGTSSKDIALRARWKDATSGSTVSPNTWPRYCLNAYSKESTPSAGSTDRGRMGAVDFAAQPLKN